MRPSVRDIWLEFNEPLEARTHWMYLDIRGFVTTAIGLLIDATRTPLQEPNEAERAASHQLARRLAWQLPDGSPAGSAEIDEEWDNVKAMMDLAPQGGGTFKDRTTLRIDDDEVDRVVFEKLDEMESVLIGREPFADFADFPADAQPGLLSMSWGMGPNFRFPKFQAFVTDGDWAGAATECRFNPDKGTIKTRNDRNQQLFRNAAAVMADESDPDVLVWPDAA
jgi:GH24 family phage-related lysozyme (muramidase)